MAQTTINSGGITDGAIVNADVKSDAAIAGSKFADNSIEEPKLKIHDAPATGEFLGYTSNGMEWVNGNTTIADDSVTAGKTSISIVSGDIIYGNGTDSWTRLAKGTDGQVLTLASGVPSWSSESVTQTKGTWNPTFTNFGSPSYTTREGGWIRTGDLLVVNFYINYTGGTASSTAYIGDLPVDVGNEPKEVTGFVSVSTSGTTGGENKTYLLQPTSASTKGFYFQPIREDLTAAQIQGTINIILGV